MYLTDWKKRHEFVLKSKQPYQVSNTHVGVHMDCGPTVMAICICADSHVDRRSNKLALIDILTKFHRLLLWRASWGTADRWGPIGVDGIKKARSFAEAERKRWYTVMGLVTRVYMGVAVVGRSAGKRLSRDKVCLLK